MVRVFLLPFLGRGRSVIDIVPDYCLSTAISDGALNAKLRLFPVFFETPRIGYLHRINATAYGIYLCPPHSDPPSAGSCGATNGWLTWGKGAHPVKWVW